MADHEALATALEEWWQDAGWQIRGIDHELPYKAIVDVVLAAGLEQVGYCWPSVAGDQQLLVREEPPWNADPARPVEPVYRLRVGTSDRSRSGE